jgi:hypothetical protein
MPVLSILRGRNRLWKKAVFQAKSSKRRTSGAKAHVDFIAFMYGLKPVPFTGLSFSAACEAGGTVYAIQYESYGS